MPWAKEERRRWQRKYYREHKDKRRKQIYEARAKRFTLIVRELGGKCFICGATEPLVIHHLGYTGGPTRSLKALRAGKIILLCRKHHRAVHYVNELKRASYLDQILKLLNDERHPYKK